MTVFQPGTYWVYVQKWADTGWTVTSGDGCCLFETLGEAYGMSVFTSHAQAKTDANIVLNNNPSKVTNYIVELTYTETGEWE